jgi:hypothetical protein
MAELDFGHQELDGDSQSAELSTDRPLPTLESGRRDFAHSQRAFAMDLQLAAGREAKSLNTPGGKQTLHLTQEPRTELKREW